MITKRKLEALERAEIFTKSHLADNYIADMQQAFANGMDGNTYWEAKSLATFDHLVPFKKQAPQQTKALVLAYPASTKADYIANMAGAFQKFVSALSIEAFYMLEFNQGSFMDFPFENFRKRNAFRRIAKCKSPNLGFKINTDLLPQVLPLFYFSKRYNIAVLTLLSANDEIPIAVELCDDGNWHIHYTIAIEEALNNAADAAGLIKGNLILCSKYCVSQLR